MSVSNTMGYSADDVVLERKWLAHFLDEGFGTGDYKRLGSDLESYSIEMNAEVEQKTNIIGESSTKVKGFKPKASVDTYIAKTGSKLFEALYNIINNKSTGTALQTRVADVMLEYDGSSASIIDVWTESVIIVPVSLGGDTSAVQIPYEIYYNGDRKHETLSKCSLSGNTLTITD